jgi:hypothetical protein
VPLGLTEGVFQGAPNGAHVDLAPSDCEGATRLGLDLISPSILEDARAWRGSAPSILDPDLICFNDWARQFPFHQSSKIEIIYKCRPFYIAVESASHFPYPYNLACILGAADGCSIEL